MLDPSLLVEQLGIFAIFLEGLLSFFSPCVLPLVPLYLSYLSMHHETRKKTIWFTICFIVGILSALLLLNASMGMISALLKDYQAYIVLVGGVIVVVMGLVQLGIIQIPLLQRTYRLPNTLQKGMSAVSALVMGFCFSFAWTPCIGPALTSILLLASSQDSFIMSNIYMLVYAAGLCIPFIIVACFSDSLLKKIQSKEKWMKLAMKIGAIILLGFGCFMIYQGATALKPMAPNHEQSSDQEMTMDEIIEMVCSYEVEDLNGKKVSLNDVKGKYVFLNFWATWCPPCQSEMPELQALYEKYLGDDVAVVTISMPDTKQSVEDIKNYIQQEGYSFPVWIDDGFFSVQFNVASLPTSYVIQKDGRPYGYVSGALDLEMMENMIQQVKAAESDE